MKEARVDRRKFIAALAGSAAVISALPRKAFGLMTSGPRSHPLNSTETRSAKSEETVKSSSRIKFAVIGINHDHIHGQIEAVVRGGGEFVSFYAKEPDLAAAFSKRYPQAKLARSENEILEDPRDPAGGKRRHPERACSAGHPGDATRQGLHVRQAGHHHARAARRSAPGASADPPHLFNHV